ncbi:glycosyl transferase family protein [Pseudidiomarina insulisalsae]|uniref:Glycosyl transferase family 2 n=1 Tax=Pseudidiomarina insulisalsae TaxID=575789 RepID=A0A432YPU7_9GAMM|nr:glycosyl transferase family protein [Pseudidiomarina insulisalsae]RUO63150.1 glycosyl transferase family 2 [Pseudidiomarina insulisalsae]
MTWFDVFVLYLYGLKWLAIVVVVILFIFGLDDFFIDCYYWVRHLYRKLTVYRKYDYSDPDKLLAEPEKPLAIMIPAWREVGVVDKMAATTAASLDYENYQIFVGTYPNDPETQAEVDHVVEHYPNVHKVICAEPGPTSKADCLNNIIASIIEFEKKTKIEFDGFILHDAEDVISSMELRLFNYLVGRKDMVQLPVYPFPQNWYDFTAAHYLDEFAELHGKDIVVRESIAGQVPSAGVGTCFSRRAMLRLLKEGDGLPFDVRSLTEDYDIGFRLKAWGMEEIFVRYPVKLEQAQLREKHAGVDERDGNVVCVREYFPTTFKTSVRQKTRWIIGIIFQGSRKLKWTKDWRINYFLWRDRRGALANIVSFLAMAVFIQLLAIWIIEQFIPNSYRVLSIFEDQPVFIALLMANLFFLANRLFQRFYFAKQYYGWFQGFMSIVRIFWGTVINFAASLRAIKQVLQHGDPRKVAWDKTSHIFPVVAPPRKQPLGSILIANGHLTEAQLEQALLERPLGIRLGVYLVTAGFVTLDQLSEAIAVQEYSSFQACDPFELDKQLIDQLPAELAFKYSILPLAEEGRTLIVGREYALSPVAEAALSRKLKRPVRGCVTTQGAVTLGLRYWYMNDEEADPREFLTQARENSQLTEQQVQLLRDAYFIRQLPFGAALVQSRVIDPAVMAQVMLSYDRREEKRLGDYLVSQSIITDEQREQAAAYQQRHQIEMKELLSEAVAGQPGITCVF